MGTLLRAGVALAAAVVLAGGALYLARHGGEPADRRVFAGEPAELCSPAGVLGAALRLGARGVIQLGLLLLIATPVARVVFSVFAFARQRDYAYVLISLLVLTALAYSLLSGQGAG